LANKDLKPGSVIVTGSNVVLAFSKETRAIERKGTMGIDGNGRNVTWSDSLGESKAEDTSVICEVKELYNEVKARITRRTYKDRRVTLQLLGKYGKRQRDRTSQKIHRISKKIVRHAKENGLGIAMENLKGIRKKYRKGNGQRDPFAQG
jgi:putative transposase